MDGSKRNAKATLHSRSASLHSGRLTRDMRFGARLAPHPYSAATIKMIKYGCSGTSHILKR